MLLAALYCRLPLEKCTLLVSLIENADLVAPLESKALSAAGVGVVCGSFSYSPHAETMSETVAIKKSNLTFL